MDEEYPGDESWVGDMALQFDRDWKSGPQPRIEDYLADLAGPRRALLLEELLRVELERRRARGEAPTPEEYHRRFPGDAPAIDAAFGPATADWPDAEAAPLRAPQPTVEGPGTVIAGRYKLLEVIGEGGMGTVWVADQTQPVRRKVALKLIKPGMDSRQVLARFEAERQALALMDHPNIAKVLDGGLTGAGRPFFVMDYVKGVPITEYCDATRLSVRERLELLAPVCRAVQHAHQKGILHRDLKPSNILIAPYDGRPVPKVIDFGLAKALHQPLTERTLHTGHGTIVGTTRYMSPEQAQLNNLDVDTRTDVYSLGVLLYELLAGTTPLEERRVKEAAWDDIRRMIREEEPPRPSVRLSSTDTLPSLAACRQTEPARLTKLVRGELDWIVMKALEKDRTRRYETANDLARDIERHLAGDPVLARSPSPAYRLRKFARKHRAALTVASAFAALLVLTAFFSSVLAFRALRAESATKQEQAKTKAALAQAETSLAAEHEAHRRASVALAAATRANAEAKQQRARAEAREQLAIDAVMKFRDAVQANPELKNRPELEALRKALLKEPLEFFRKLRDQIQASRDTRPEALERLSIANYELARTTAEIGSITDAIRSYRESIIICERLVRDHPAADEYRHELAASHHDLGVLLRATGDPAEARQALRRALAIRERLASEHPTVAEYRRELAASHDDLALLQEDTRHLGEALRSNGRALAIRERLASEHPTVAMYQRDLATSHYNIGMSLSATRHPAEALESHRRALAIRERLASEHPTVAMYQRDLATSHHILKLAHLEPNQSAEAYRAARERAGLIRRNPTALYNAACGIAMDVPRFTGNRKQFQIRVAIERLKESIDAGWDDVALISRDSALDPIRDCDAFRRLLAELLDRGFPVDPFAP